MAKIITVAMQNASNTVIIIGIGLAKNAFAGPPFIPPGTQSA